MNIHDWIGLRPTPQFRDQFPGEDRGSYMTKLCAASQAFLMTERVRLDQLRTTILPGVPGE
jgi:hypothetical protein